METHDKEHEEHRFDSDARRERNEANGFRFDKTITLGNVVSTGMAIMAVAIAYTKLEGRTTNTETAIAKVEAKVDVVSVAQTDTNLLVRELKTIVQFEGRKTRDEAKP